MRDATAQCVFVSEEIRKVFQGIRKIIDEDEEQDWALDTALGCSSLDR